MKKSYIAATAILLLSLSLPSFAQSVAVIKHQLEPFNRPAEITSGPDDALWFTEPYSNTIGRISTLGAVSYFPVSIVGTGPWGITAGPDGALWFAELDGNKIGRITTAGLITEYALPNTGSDPQEITAGPDGALWFTESSAPRIGRITVSGTITEFPVSAQGITAGPDGALWFTSPSQIGRITTNGAITFYPLPDEGSNPLEITTGPDGALWFTDTDIHNIPARVGRITVHGAITTFTLPPTEAQAYSIAAGPDGALWFTILVPGSIARITTDGVITQFSKFSGEWITAGPGGALWFTAESQYHASLGQIVFPTADLSLDPPTASPGTNLTLTGSGYEGGEFINLYANSTGANLLTTAQADASGSFSKTGDLPQIPFGGKAIVGVGQSSAKLGVADLSVIPRLVLSPATGSPGSSVTAEGFGFGPNESVSVYWNVPRVSLGSATTDIKGSFNGESALTFPIPLGAQPGVNLLFARGNQTYAISKGYVTVQ